MDLCLQSGNGKVWNILVWCNHLKTWFKLEPKWPTQKIWEWKIYFILGCTEEGNTGGQKPWFSMFTLAKYQNAFFFLNEASFLYYFQWSPCFCQKFQPLLGNCTTLGFPWHDWRFLVHAVGKIFMRPDSCLNFIWSCISVIQHVD